MAELLKALAVVLAVSFSGFVFARIAFQEIADGRTINRWRNIYLATTIAFYLIPNFWLVLFAIGLIAIFLGASEKNKPALYLLLLFAIPVADAVVPGFGGIDNFLGLFPFNILALAILFPVLFSRGENREYRRIGSTADMFFAGFSLLMLVLAFRNTTITDGFRQFFSYVLTAFGPYLVFSRINWTKERLKLASLALVVPIVILSALAVAEVILGWHFFPSAVYHWDIPFRVRYTSRSGFLRAYTTVMEPIAFGLFLAAALPPLLALISSIKKRKLAMLSFGAVCVALLSTFSRGPWVGAAFGVIAFAATSEKPFANMTRLGFAGLAGVLALSLTPLADDLYNMLPFIGDTSASSVDYRQALMDIGWEVAMETPLFGSENYMQHPAMQQLIQGQGIIDIVNSYLRITLESGLVGLSLFVGVSGFSVLTLFRALERARAQDPEYAIYCQAWLAALACTLLVIATTSSVVAQVAEFHWLLCGICVGLARSIAAMEDKGALVAESEEPPPGAPPPKRPKADAAAPPPAHLLPPHLRQYGRSQK